eukprot:11193131-Lingulodinium_polyedra.AAC.1
MRRAVCLPSTFGAVKREARYLGPLLHHGGAAFPEITRRIAAATAAYYSYARLWNAKVDFRFKKLVFVCV